MRLRWHKRHLIDAIGLLKQGTQEASESVN
jgi:hypothetical protein